MGMFDNLRVKARLPDPAYQDRTFQTKSLECGLSDYTITREGRLVLREVSGRRLPRKRCRTMALRRGSAVESYASSACCAKSQSAM